MPAAAKQLGGTVINKLIAWGDHFFGRPGGGVRGLFPSFLPPCPPMPHTSLDDPRRSIFDLMSQSASDLKKFWEPCRQSPSRSNVSVAPPECPDFCLEIAQDIAQHPKKNAPDENVQFFINFLDVSGGLLLELLKIFFRI